MLLDCSPTNLASLDLVHNSLLYLHRSYSSLTTYSLWHTLIYKHILFLALWIKLSFIYCIFYLCYSFYLCVFTHTSLFSFSIWRRRLAQFPPSRQQGWRHTSSRPILVLHTSTWQATARHYEIGQDKRPPSCFSTTPKFPATNLMKIPDPAF